MNFRKPHDNIIRVPENSFVQDNEVIRQLGIWTLYSTEKKITGKITTVCNFVFIMLHKI